MHFARMVKQASLDLMRVPTLSFVGITSSLEWYVRFSILPPANEVCKGYVLHVSVILSTGGVSAPLHARIHTLPHTRGRYTPPPGADTPWEQTPQTRGRYPHPRYGACWKIQATNGR